MVFSKHMNTYRSNGLFKDWAVFFLLVYLFYVLTNLFFFPDYKTSPARVIYAHGIRLQSIQTNYDTPGFINIGERTVLDDDSLNFIKSSPVFFLIAFFGYRLFRMERRPMAYPRYLVTDLQHSYLTFCILRI
ncbi:hypothetical protein LX99_01409 [Mucilaginibacter oryzae]|uniref:Uncharacterized protein n=1 Tax=Mucilaginibacter oryzae TaxID=468058 RepID=A0A316HL59_9SPHI|nr:hypothetical protein LX99_01409 [Mucilaginibacter oryzae]